MSAIDCYDHEYLGHFSYLPIYHPTMVIDDQDIAADETCLLLGGGGGGEHPAITVRNLDSLVFAFLRIQFDDAEDHLTVEEEEALNAYPYAEDVFSYNAGWHIKEHHNLYKLLEKHKLRDEHFAPELLLAQILGELVFFSMPHLIQNRALVDQLAAKRKLHPIFEVVKISPPGYPQYYGRKTVDGETAQGAMPWILSEKP